MRIFLYFLLLVFLFGLSKTNVSAQYLNSDSAFLSGAANTGRLYTNIFLDYYYKSHIDSLIRGTGVNQYSGVTKDKNAFAFRRIYLGYDYNISKKFSTELLLAAEDQLYITTLSGANTYSGDLLPKNKYSFYIKLANLRWKNIWKRTDLVVGQSNTPAFPFLTQKIWGYRNLEKTIADIRKIPSIDLGVSLQGKFDRDDKYGYSVMIGNGTGARVENDRFKRLYGEIYGKFFNKKIIFLLKLIKVF